MVQGKRSVCHRGPSAWIAVEATEVFIEVDNSRRRARVSELAVLRKCDLDDRKRVKPVDRLGQDAAELLHRIRLVHDKFVLDFLESQLQVVYESIVSGVDHLLQGGRYISSEVHQS